MKSVEPAVNSHYYSRYDQSLIALMGCHGVGKSTLLNAIEREYSCTLPPSTIPNEFFENAILSFIHYIIERKKQHSYLSRFHGRIATDRYAFLDTSIYMQVLHSLGYCSDQELQLYARLVNNLDHVWIPPTLLLVVVCEPATILSRLQKRPKSSGRHYRPFDLNFISAINTAFADFGNGGMPPAFLSHYLRSLVQDSQRIIIDTSNIDPQQAIAIALQEVHDVWKTE